MSAPLLQTDIEGEIVRLSDLLEQATEDAAVAWRNAAQANADYRREYAKAFLVCRVKESMSEKTSEAKATEVVEEKALLTQRYLTEAEARSLEEKCRSLRAQLDAVRTLSANVRAQGG